jgi:hypothetical protein
MIVCAKFGTKSGIGLLKIVVWNCMKTEAIGGAAQTTMQDIFVSDRARATWIIFRQLIYNRLNWLKKIKKCCDAQFIMYFI